LSSQAAEISLLAKNRKQLRRAGAVGDICFPFIDKQGGLFDSALMRSAKYLDRLCWALSRWQNGRKHRSYCGREYLRLA